MNNFYFSASLVPKVLCQVPQSSDGKILVSWDYKHTGGLNLTQVTIEYKQQDVQSFQLLSDSSVVDSEDLLSMKYTEVLNFTAGFNYTFRITAANENGINSINCPSILHTVGIVIIT